MSSHACPVVRIKKLPHPNADSLSIQEINGWEVCMRTDEWEDGSLAVYVPPDYVVPDSPLFRWLAGSSKNWQRIKAKRFRGRYSYGILVPAPDGLQLGEDAMSKLGIVRWEPPEPSGFGIGANSDNEAPPPGVWPKYDVENYQPYNWVLQPGEEVVVTEKIHGTNARFLALEGKQWAGSRTQWKAEGTNCVWRECLKQNPWIAEWCQEHPGLLLYGEVYGWVQKLRYGARPGQLFFAPFDILDRGQWLDYDDARSLLPDQWVPVLYRGPFDPDKCRELALLDSTLAPHISEGVVIRPVVNRYERDLGRVQLKLVSARYLEKSDE